MKASEQQALIPQEATHLTRSSTSSARRSRSPRPRPSCSRHAATSWTPKNKQEHIDKWGGIHAITEAVYDCADLAQRILDDLRRSLDMDDGDVEATVDPDTGEID